MFLTVSLSLTLCVTQSLCTLLILTFLLCSSLSLTSSQPHTRARGVQLLSEVLHECYGVFTEAEGDCPFYPYKMGSIM